MEREFNKLCIGNSEGQEIDSAFSLWEQKLTMGTDRQQEALWYSSFQLIITA